MALDVFISVGQTFTRQQEEFVSAVERCLLERDLRPRTLGRNEWSSQQPLQAIKERMESCAGTVVVAFERLYVADGIEKRGGSAERLISEERRTTIWNQMEAAMAYGLGQPLMVLSEEGVWAEGVLEPRNWAVHSLRLDPEDLRTPQFTGILEDWKRHVVEFASRREKEMARAEDKRADLTDRTVGEILGELRPGQFRALVIAVISTLVAVAGTAFSLGVKFG